MEIVGSEVSCQSQKTLAQMSEVADINLENHSAIVPGYVDFEGFFCREGSVPVSLRSAR